MPVPRGDRRQNQRRGAILPNVGKAALILLIVGLTGTVISVAIFAALSGSVKPQTTGGNETWVAMSILGFTVFGSMAASAAISWYQESHY